MNSRIASASLLIAAMITSPTLLAGKPVKDSDATPWLEGPMLITDVGGQQAAVESTDIVYGDTIGFVEHDILLTSTQRSYVTVVCVHGGEVVYQASNWGEEVLMFTMEDLSGQGLDWPVGSTADCSASLIIQQKKGKSYEVITQVDKVHFPIY